VSAYDRNELLGKGPAESCPIILMLSFLGSPSESKTRFHVRTFFKTQPCSVVDVGLLVPLALGEVQIWVH